MALRPAVAVDEAVMTGVIAHRSLGGIVVTFAVTASFATATHLLAVTIARYWPFAAVWLRWSTVNQTVTI